MVEASFGYGDPSFYLANGASQAGLPYSLAASEQFKKDLDSGVIEVTAGVPMINFKNATALARYFGYAPGGEFLAPNATLHEEQCVDSGLPGVQGIVDNPDLVADIANNVISDVATITASAGANGTIAPSGATVVQMGNNLLVTVTPGAHYHIASLLVDGAGVPLVSPYHFEDIRASHTIAATFAIDTNTVTFNLAGGTRTGGGALVQQVDYNGNAVAPTLTPPSGKQFNSWNHSLNNIIAAQTITAVYDTVWVMTMAGVGTGTVTPALGPHTVLDGVAQAITATALNFVNWTVTGGATVDTPNSNTANATLTADGTVTANWSA